MAESDHAGGMEIDDEAAEGLSGDEYCQMVGDAALKEWFTRCDSAAMMLDQFAAILGVDPEGIDEAAVLDDGPPVDGTPDDVRAWVLCRAFSDAADNEPLVEAHDGDAQTAIDDAWNEYRAAESETDEDE